MKAASAIPTDPSREWAAADADWFVNKSRHNLLLLRKAHEGEIDDSHAAYPLPGGESYFVLVRFQAGGNGKILAKSIVVLENRHLPMSMTDEDICSLARKNSSKLPAGAKLCG